MPSSPSSKPHCPTSRDQPHWLTTHALYDSGPGLPAHPASLGHRDTVQNAPPSVRCCEHQGTSPASTQAENRPLERHGRLPTTANPAGSFAASSQLRNSERRSYFRPAPPWSNLTFVLRLKPQNLTSYFYLHTNDIAHHVSQLRRQAKHALTLPTIATLFPVAPPPRLSDPNEVYREWSASPTFPPALNLTGHIPALGSVPMVASFADLSLILAPSY